MVKELVKVIVTQRIYQNEKLARLVGRLGKHQRPAWRFIAWLKKNPRIDKRLRGKLIDTVTVEEKHGNDSRR
jgi:hypothetical protein